MKQIDLSSLPKRGKLIDWKNSVGCVCDFIYDDVQGAVKIIDYISGTHCKISISYNEDIYTLDTESFKKAKFDYFLKKITADYRYNINDIIKSTTGEIKIINRNKIFDATNHKWKTYEIQCLKCQKTRWVKESYLMHSTPSCLYCNKNIHTLQKGINDIPTTHPWAVQYFQGGEEEASLYSAGSGKQLFFKCPICNQIAKRPRAINDLIKYHSIGCQCDGKLSFPELIVFNLLNQFNIKFYTQASNIILSWAGTKRYDFYLPDNNCIIETHGKQHYTQTKLIGRTLQEEQANDKYKKELAIKNGILNYFEINCSESDINFILNSCENEGLFTFLHIDREKINFDNLYYNKLHDEINQCKQILELNSNIYYADLKRQLNLKHSYDLDRILSILQVKVNTNHQFQVNVYYDDKLLKSFPSFAAFKREGEQKYYLSFYTLKKYIAEKKIYKNHYSYTLGGAV